MTIFQQLLLFIGGLFLLLLAVKILQKVYLFPAVLCYACMEWFPRWYENNLTLCRVLLGIGIAYFILAWVLKFLHHRREKQQAIAELLARARPLYPEMADPHWYEKE